MLPIDSPIQLPPQRLGAEWSVLPAWIPVAEMGVLPVNAFVRDGAEPLLVDTGLAALGDAFIDALGQVLDPASLRWVWLSHTDPDHTGNLVRVLERAPQAQVLTSFLGMAKLGLSGFDTSRVHLLEPGVAFQLGDERLHPLRPPYYDAPESMGFYDEHADVLFAVDSFGALLPELVDSANGLDSVSLRISNPFGPRQHPHKRQGVIPIFLQHIAQGRPIPVFGDGSMVRDYLFVGDAAQMVSTVLGAKPTREVYNLGSGEGASVAELVALCRDVTGRRVEVEYLPTPSTFVNHIVLDVARFTEEFGVTASVPLREGIERTWHSVSEE